MLETMMTIVIMSTVSSLWSCRLNRSLNKLNLLRRVRSADLIMLGLATHEPNFTIIREEFKPNKPRPCALCGQMGHEIKDCQGTAREKQGEVGVRGARLSSTVV